MSFRVADCETTGTLFNDLEGCLDGVKSSSGMLIDDARGEMAGGRSYISISVSLSVTRTP